MDSEYSRLDDGTESVCINSAMTRPIPILTKKNLNIIRWTLLALLCTFNILYKGSYQANQLILAEARKQTNFTITELSMADNIKTVSAILLIGPVGVFIDKHGISLPFAGLVTAKLISNTILLLNNNVYHSKTLLYLSAPLEGPIEGIYAIVLFKLLLRWFSGKLFSIAIVIDGLSLGAGILFGGLTSKFLSHNFEQSVLVLAINIYSIVLMLIGLGFCIVVGRMDRNYGSFFSAAQAGGDSARAERWRKNLKLPIVIIIICIASVFIDSVENVVKNNQSYFLKEKFDYTPDMLANLSSITIGLEALFSLASVLIFTLYGYQSLFYLSNAMLLCSGTFWSGFLVPKDYTSEFLLPNVPLYFIQMGSAIKTLAFKTMVPNVVDPNVIGTVFGTTGSVQAAVGSFVVLNGFSLLHDYVPRDEDKYYWSFVYAGSFAALGITLIVVAIVLNYYKGYGLDRPLKKMEKAEINSAALPNEDEIEEKTHHRSLLSTVLPRSDDV